MKAILVVALLLAAPLSLVSTAAASGDTICWGPASSQRCYQCPTTCDPDTLLNDVNGRVDTAIATAVGIVTSVVDKVPSIDPCTATDPSPCHVPNPQVPECFLESGPRLYCEMPTPRQW